MSSSSSPISSNWISSSSPGPKVSVSLILAAGEKEMFFSKYFKQNHNLRYSQELRTSAGRNLKLYFYSTKDNASMFLVELTVLWQLSVSFQTTSFVCVVLQDDVSFIILKRDRHVRQIWTFLNPTAIHKVYNYSTILWILWIQSIQEVFTKKRQVKWSDREL